MAFADPHEQPGPGAPGAWFCTGPRARFLRSAGKPYPWVEMRIVDPDTGHDRPAGQVGELWTRSVQNMKGYWSKPEETARAFTADGWLKTGDAGFMDPEGYVFLTDRVKDMIVSGGENIYPAEVENALSGHPAIADVVVIGVPHDRWGETVKAIVVRRPSADPSPGDIIEYARQRQKTKYARPRGSDSVRAAGKVGSRGTSSTLTRLLPAKFKHAGGGPVKACRARSSARMPTESAALHRVIVSVRPRSGSARLSEQGKTRSAGDWTKVQ